MTTITANVPDGWTKATIHISLSGVLVKSNTAGGSYRFEGLKYVDGMSLKDIAKGIRKDIKEASDGVKLPRALKVSVRGSKASMCQSIDIEVKAGVSTRNEWMILREQLGTIANKYNSHHGADCSREHHTFYCHPSIDCDLMDSLDQDA